MGCTARCAPSAMRTKMCGRAGLPFAASASAGSWSSSSAGAAANITMPHARVRVRQIVRVPMRALKDFYFSSHLSTCRGQNPLGAVLTRYLGPPNGAYELGAGAGTIRARSARSECYHSTYGAAQTTTTTTGGAGRSSTASMGTWAAHAARCSADGCSGPAITGVIF